MEPVRAGVSEPTTFSIVDFIEQGFRDLDKAHEGLDKYNASQSFLKPENFTEDMDLDPKDFIFEAIAALDDFNLHLSRAIAFLHHCPPSAFEFYAEVVSTMRSNTSNIPDYVDAQVAATEMLVRATQLHKTPDIHADELAEFADIHHDPLLGTDEYDELMYDFDKSLENFEGILFSIKNLLRNQYPHVGFVVELMRYTDTWVRVDENNSVPAEYYDALLACALHAEARRGFSFLDEVETYRTEYDIDVEAMLSGIAERIPKIHSFLRLQISDFSFMDPDKRPDRNNPRSHSIYASEVDRLPKPHAVPLWERIQDHNERPTYNKPQTIARLMSRGDYVGYDDPELDPDIEHRDEPSIDVVGELEPVTNVPRAENALAISREVLTLHLN